MPNLAVGTQKRATKKILLYSAMTPYIPPHDNGPELIYADEYLLAVNKPAGLLSVPGRGTDKQDSQATRIQKVFADALIVHRLDMATSGLLVFARGHYMQRRLSELFRERLVTKSYVAIASGKVASECGEINMPIVADWPERPRRRIDEKLGKPSLTRYQVLLQKDDNTRIALEPVTGRTHQLRVHLLAIGHPIVGDALYGGQPAERLMLHAHGLDFVHPVTDSQIRLISEPPF